MSNPVQAPLDCWLAEPLPAAVEASVATLRSADDVQRVCLMPDVHLASEVCVGAVVATTVLIYPQAVGGDIGCGMAALPFDVEAAAIDNPQAAARLLAALYQQVPSNKHRQARTLPETLPVSELSTRSLAKAATREGGVQLGTLGRGNHFLEFQADQAGQLWVMLHSGSRAMGQRITEHHLSLAEPTRGGLRPLDANDERGQAYLNDMAWARRYAAANRLAMLVAVEQAVRQLFRATADWVALLHADHNHVQREMHGGETWLVHRKGAQSARAGEPGIVPGSMGSASFHTIGRGCERSLCSCSHGAGRRLSRTEARRKITAGTFRQQVGGLWYDHRRAAQLTDESPAAYKDIHRVMRAQKELAKVTRTLSPVLNYKGT